MCQEAGKAAFKPEWHQQLLLTSCFLDDGPHPWFAAAIRADRCGVDGTTSPNGMFSTKRCEIIPCKALPRIEFNWEAEAMVVDRKPWSTF
jgi:hypothetical protein